MQNTKGFTLIELLLVVSLVAISVGVTSDILLTLVRSYNKSQVTNEIEQGTNFISQKLTKELRNAKTITEIDDGSGTPLPIVQGSSGFGITFTDRNNDVISYTIENSLVSRSFNGTEDNLNINDIGGISASCGTPSCFTILQVSPQVVQISITLTQGGTSSNKIFSGQIDINDTIVIRDTY